ncbi:cyclopropane-fatty-acyl-phospholipid synthase [Marasmius fiardii PR-910]|nr:cyclopropane-fatty-acyl-phospholipid synthase [Marasmius fiardii PR-910]
MSSQLLDTPVKHPISVSGLADRAINNVIEVVLRTGWTPLTKLAEAAVVALMRNITKGRLRVLTFSHIYTFPDHSAENTEGHKADLRVVKDTFWVRLCAMGDLGFSEAYMYGDVECDDLVSLFQIFLDNRDRLSNMDSSLSFLFTLPQRLTSYRFLNTIGNSRSNISAHYDISNDMFSGFLSQDMTYSCAIFQDLDGDLKGGGGLSEWSGGQGLKRLGQEQFEQYRRISDHNDLHNAQIRKLDYILKKAKIRRGDRVLEIGSGWGSMAIYIAQNVPDTTIDTITLSVHQQLLARERIAAEGLTDRINVHLMDYRDMPSKWEGAFDRVVSIEMIEAVGKEFLVTYWQKVNWAMKRKDGVGVVQSITIPESRYERYSREIDFIRKWVFPGGILPTVTLLLQTLQEGSRGTLTVDSITNIGPHYARTLREWRKRFLDRFETVIVPALQREYPETMSGPRGRDEIEVFKRKWIYYYCYCEVGFTTRTLGDHIITFTREGCQDYGCNV